MKCMYVYILKCSDGSYYTGVTNDIKRRMIEHNAGEDENAYTFKRRPVELVFCEMLTAPKEAIELEKQIKRWTRKKKEALIERNWHKLKELAVCKNLTSHRNFQKKNKRITSSAHGSTQFILSQTKGSP